MVSVNYIFKNRGEAKESLEVLVNAKKEMHCDMWSCRKIKIHEQGSVSDKMK